MAGFRPKQSFADDGGCDLADGTLTRGRSPKPGILGGKEHPGRPAERPPDYAFLNREGVLRFRPSEEKVAAWHRVTSGREENFRTIAEQYEVPVERLIEFNFPGSVKHGRVDPAVVNWYLHHHKGFSGGPMTRDHFNYMFKGGEKVAIPYLGRVEIGEPEIGPKPSLDDPRLPEVIASEKFTYEFKIPKLPREVGYFLAQARIALEGEIVKEKGLVKTAFKKDQIKLAIEKKFDEDFKGTFGVKIDEKTLSTVAEEIKKGSKEGFVRAVAAPFEASLKQSYRLGKLKIVPELGAEFSTTPVVIRLAGEYEDTFLVDGLNLKGKFVVKIGFNVGLSRQGWAWVAQRVGGEAIKRFIGTAGRAMVGLWEYLVAEGIVLAGGVAIGAIVGTFALTYLTAWLVADARRKGELTGLATWYVSAYSAKVFREPRPSGFITGDTKLRDELVRLGEQDAVAEARAALGKLGKTANSDDHALEEYRSLLIQNDNGKVSMAKWRLQRSLEDRSKKLAGL